MMKKPTKVTRDLRDYYDRWYNSEKYRLLKEYPSDEYGVYGHCSIEKIRAWEAYKRVADYLRITSKSTDNFSCAGIITRDGVEYFHVWKSKYNEAECPLSWLEG